MRFLLPRIEQLPLWPVISAPVFLLLFVGLVWWIYRKDRKHIYEQVQRLPLEQEEDFKNRDVQESR